MSDVRSWNKEAGGARSDKLTWYQFFYLLSYLLLNIIHELGSTIYIERGVGAEWQYYQRVLSTPRT